MSSSLSKWRRHIEKQRESEFSIEDYCRKNKLKSHMFHYYRRKFFGPKDDGSAFVPAMVAEQPKTDAPMWVVFESGIRLEFSNGVEPERLLAVINLLKRSA